MTVVVGTTLRPEDASLLELAALLAARRAVPLRLVHVCEDGRAPLVIDTDQEHVLGNVRADLWRLAEELQQTSGAIVQPHLAAGSTVEVLVSLAAFELASVLVVGPTTRRMRNTAERVARSSRVPVLVPRSAERLASWLRGERPLRILVGADLGRAARAARRFAATLSELGPAEVEIACVASPEETHARLGLAPPATGLSDDAEAAVLRELADGAPPEEVSAALRVIRGHGRIEGHLAARADEGDFDVIVVGRRRHSLVEQLWHGSVARGVLNSASVTVASVPVPIGEVDGSFRPPRVIVVGADFTELDHRALAHAIGHASDGATVHLVHALGTSAPRTTLAPESVESRHERDHASRRLLELVRQADGFERSISMETHVLEGPAGEQLLALCERVGADLLVLGTRRRSAIGRVVLGSVTRSVVEASRFPVLLVPAAFA